MLIRYWLLIAVLIISGCGETPQADGSAWYLSFSPDSHYLLATGRFDNAYTTQVFSIAKQRYLTRIASLSTQVGNAEWSHDSQKIFFLNTEQHRIDVFDVKQKSVKEGCDFQWPAGIVNQLTENTLVVAPILVADFKHPDESPAVINDCCSVEQSTTTEFGGCDSGTIFSVSCAETKEGSVAASYFGDCSVEIWDYRNETMMLRYRLPQLTDCWVKLSPDGQRLAALKADGLSVWKLGQSAPEQLFKINKSSVSTDTIGLDYALLNRLSFSRDGERLAVCFDKEVQVIEVSDEKMIFSRNFGRASEVVTCAISPDGKWIAFSGNLGTGICLQTINTANSTTSQIP